MWDEKNDKNNDRAKQERENEEAYYAIANELESLNAYIKGINIYDRRATEITLLKIRDCINRIDALYSRIF